MYLPYEIQNLIGDEPYNLDEVGMSGSAVCIFSDKVLKIQDITNETVNEFRMLKWLSEKQLAPQVLAYVEENGKNYLLMEKLDGMMSCKAHYMDQAELLMELLARALHMLWEVDVTDCPSTVNLDVKLEMARYNVEHDLVDVENVQPDTFGEGGFKDPQALLEWLIANRPKEDMVLSHGDFCLPNVFLKGEQVVGFIDVGKACVSDRYQDIALCYRSLTSNLNGEYGGRVRTGVDSKRLFEKIGIEPDWEKIRYYTLLDELF